MKAKGNKYCWVVAYIDSTFLGQCQDQLTKHREYKEVEPLIPTVKVLKKKFKNKLHFEDVPLLFQYGFFKIPRSLAIHHAFLENLQKDISCIYGWVKDPLKKVRSRIVEKGQEKGLSDLHVPVATATAEEISELIKATVNIGAHSADDINMLSSGDWIILKGYPYEGMNAEFISKNDKKRLVRVRLILFDAVREVEVSFDNVFFTLYENEGYDETKLSKTSLDDMGQKNTLDKLMKKTQKSSEPQ